MALVDGRYDAALELFEDAAGRHEQLGREREAAALASKIGHALRRNGRTSEAIDRMSGALALLSDADRDAAQLNVELGVALLAAGRPREAVEPLERALELAQALELPHVLAGALTFKAQVCVALSRSREARILFAGAIELCREYEFSDRLLIVQLNSGDFLRKLDLPGAAERTGDALATARRVGSRVYESVAASNLMRVWEYTGAWDDVERLGTDLLESGPERPGVEYIHLGLALVAAFRGDAQAAGRHLDGMSPWRHSEANEARWTYTACQATIALVAGDPAAALDGLSGAMGNIIAAEGVSSQASRIGFPTAIEAAVALGEVGQATALLRLLAEVPPGHVPPFLRAERARGEGLVAALVGDTVTARARFGAAIEELTSLGYPYWLARAQTGLARVLIDDGRSTEAQPMLDEAVAELRKLRAAPALAIAEALLAGLPAAARG